MLAHLKIVKIICRARNTFLPACDHFFQLLPEEGWMRAPTTNGVWRDSKKAAGLLVTPPTTPPTNPTPSNSNEVSKDFAFVSPDI